MVETKTKMAAENLVVNEEAFYGECLKSCQLVPVQIDSHTFPLYTVKYVCVFLCGTKNRRDTIPLSVNIHNYNVCKKMWNLSQCTHIPKI